MADLMTDVCTYDSLVNKYGNFHVPAIGLYVNGSDAIEELNLSVLSLSVTLSLSAASSAVFRLADVYDLEKRSFDSKVRQKFKLGTVVEVGIGYNSELRTVFKGFVAVIGAEFGENTCLTVTLMDVRRLMMINGIRNEEHKVGNYSEVVEKILKSYSMLCKPKIDATDDKLEKPVKQHSTDYNFITKELIGKGRCDREFLVVGDTAYFRTPRKQATAICSLEFGRELLSFRMGSSYANLNVKVIGLNEQEQQVITASDTVKATEEQSSLNAQTPVSIIVDPEADTEKKAKKRAQVHAKGQLASGQNGRGTCLGIPELVPGRFVEVVKLEPMANKKYYLKNVSHRISADGFVTEFETEGWA